MLYEPSVLGQTVLATGTVKLGLLRSPPLTLIVFVVEAQPPVIEMLKVRVHVQSQSRVAVALSCAVTVISLAFVTGLQLAKSVCISLASFRPIVSALAKQLF